jgi:3-dehydroquinate synthase
MQVLTVDLGDRSYPIYIGEQLLGKPGLLQPHIKAQQVCVVTNETIAPLYFETLQKTLPGYQIDTCVLPDGEAYKSLDVLNQIFDKLLSARHNRTTTLIALGGGVVGLFYSDTYNAFIDGGFFCGWKNRREPSPG